MSEGESMDYDLRQELDRISKDVPSFEVVLEELNLSGSPGQMFWKYYYPLCFRYAAEFFNDPEDARTAALPLFEHWLSAVQKHNNSAKLASFFLTVARHFCLNYQRDISYGPELVYQSEEGVDVIPSDDDEDDNKPVDIAFIGDYPTDGVDHDDPETLAIREEEQQIQRMKAMEVRHQLYPGDQQVFDLLLENYNSDDIASILERTVVSVENAIRRIRTTTVNRG